jgi:hypothetical protein
LERAPERVPFQLHSNALAQSAQLSEADALLQEVHHCVRNNLQIIVSLINLQRRLVPGQVRDGVSFIEEHVQAMAVVYRIADIRAGMRVSLNRLVPEVIDILRDVSGVPSNIVNVSIPQADSAIEQRRAVALALLLALIVPKTLLESPAGTPVSVTLRNEPKDGFTLSVTADWQAVQHDPLRARLSNAYLRQLTATAEADDHQVRVHFR